jgi:hypothetical protein
MKYRILAPKQAQSTMCSPLYISLQHSNQPHPTMSSSVSSSYVTLRTHHRAPCLLLSAPIGTFLLLPCPAPLPRPSSALPCHALLAATRCAPRMDSDNSVLAGRQHRARIMWTGSVGTAATLTSFY